MSENVTNGAEAIKLDAELVPVDAEGMPIIIFAENDDSGAFGLRNRASNLRFPSGTKFREMQLSSRLSTSDDRTRAAALGSMSSMPSVMDCSSSSEGNCRERSCSDDF